MVDDTLKGSIFLNYTGIFDSHAHYDDKRFQDDQAQVIEKLKESGVSAVINVGCDMKSSYSSFALTEKYPFFYCTVGIHPHDAEHAQDGYLQELETLSKRDKVVAIGEIGLDYYYDMSPREKQKEVFEQQLLLAQALDLPVIIHSRDAVEDTMKLLRQYRPKGVVHCFSGSAETAREILELDMYLGYTGVVTFHNAKKILEAVNATPMDKLLLETDCPYMAPSPFRGQRCSSELIPHIAAKIAQLKGLGVQDVIDQANRNTCTLFKIKL